MTDASIKEHVNNRTWDALEKARKHCEALLSKTQAICDRLLTEKRVSLDDVCCVVVGSVGRGEALEASDIDFIPVLGSNVASAQFEPIDKALREAIRKELNI